MTKGDELRLRLMQQKGHEYNADYILAEPITMKLTFLRKGERITEAKVITSFCYNCLWFNTTEHHSLPFWAVLEYVEI